jgi:hypothetical protein
MDINWLTTETHMIRKEELEDFLFNYGCRQISIGTFYNSLDSNGFPNEMVNLVNFSFLYDGQWMTFTGHFKDMSKYDSTLTPTAKFSLQFIDKAQ